MYSVWYKWKTNLPHDLHSHNCRLHSDFCQEFVFAVSFIARNLATRCDFRALDNWRTIGIIRISIKLKGRDSVSWQLRCGKVLQVEQRGIQLNLLMFVVTQVNHSQANGNQQRIYCPMCAGVFFPTSTIRKINWNPIASATPRVSAWESCSAADSPGITMPLRLSYQWKKSNSRKSSCTKQHTNHSTLPILKVRAGRPNQSPCNQT